MTEPEFVLVVSRRTKVSVETLERNGTVKDLFKQVDPRLAHNLLVDIFQFSIMKDKPLCDSEKQLVKEIRNWPNKSVNLEHLCHLFFEKDLR